VSVVSARTRYLPRNNMPGATESDWVHASALLAAVVSKVTPPSFTARVAPFVPGGTMNSKPSGAPLGPGESSSQRTETTGGSCGSGTPSLTTAARSTSSVPDVPTRRQQSSTVRAPAGGSTRCSHVSQSPAAFTT